MKARLIQEIGLRVYLRRFGRYDSATPNPCTASDATYSYHNAQTLIETTADVWRGVLETEKRWPLASFSRDDPRWPTHCAACGYAFTECDEWQVHPERHYDTASGKPEPGDLFYATWERLSKDRQQWETNHLQGICPNGRAWDLDGPSSNGNGWTRTGEPPNITVTPSIWIQIEGPRGYHGWLTAGEWTPDLEGRTYPQHP